MGSRRRDEATPLVSHTRGYTMPELVSLCGLRAVPQKFLQLLPHLYFTFYSLPSHIIFCITRGSDECTTHLPFNLVHILPLIFL
jgi:hypothetical protein